jgi:hypothetical protein
VIQPKRRSALALALALAAIAVAAVSAAGASAAQFHVSATGQIVGAQTTNQVFKFSAGSVTCKQASSQYSTTSSNFTFLDLRTTFSGCSSIYFGVPSQTGVEVSPADFTLRANGEADLRNALTINVKGMGCSVVFPAQTGLKSISYTNRPEGKMEGASALSGMSYNFSEGCGSPGTNGTFTGSSLYERSGGGSIQWVS